MNCGVCCRNEQTKTPITGAVESYKEYISTVKTRVSARVDSWYMRNIFESGKGLRVSFVEDISGVAVNALLVGLRRQRGLSPKTVNRYREVLHRFVNWSMRFLGVRFPDGRNPVKDAERHREKAPVIEYMDIPEIRAQLEALRSDVQLQTMVAVYIFAGLRRAEALWLTCEDVDLAAGRHGMLRVRAKTLQGKYWQPKTGINRAVPVSSALRPYLDRYAQHADPLRLWYFPSPKGTRYDEDNFSCRLRWANRGAGLSWCCKVYRHTFGTHLAMKGESLYKISELMGNSPEICRRHYAAMRPESLIESVEFDV